VIRLVVPGAGAGLAGYQAGLQVEHGHAADAGLARVAAVPPDAAPVEIWLDLVATMNPSVLVSLGLPARLHRIVALPLQLGCNGHS